MKKNILVINASVFGTEGQSSQLNQRLTDGLTNDIGDAEIVHRNLSDGSMPHFDASTMKAISEGTATFADSLIEELEAADAVIIGAPMYNFGVPSQLKSWFDHITRSGRTFKYTENGPQGLLAKRPVIVMSTRGGTHLGSSRDSVAPFIETMLGFVGLDQDAHYIHVEGLSQSAKRDAALEQAHKEVDDIAKQLKLHIEEQAA